MFKRRSSTPAPTAPASVAPPAAEIDLDRKVLVSRQPVLDTMGRVTGYRIAYALPDGAGSADDQAMSLFDTVLSDFGLEHLVGDTMAHLTISREMLLTLGTPPIRPDRLVLRIPYEAAVDETVTPTLDEAIERGYTLELDGIPAAGFELAVLERFGLVELDLNSWSPTDAAALVKQIAARHSRPLAAGVQTYDERDAAQELGFELFTGPFFGTPQIIPGRKVPTGAIQTLAALVELQSEDTSLEHAVAVIDRDLGLSVKLLRYINSAYFGMAAKVNSIRDAAIRLGTRGVARWALTVTITGAPDISPELAVLALTRARLCETLGADVAGVDGAELFTIGLLSATDAVFRRPLATIIPELPLSERVTNAILNHAGPAGEVLRAALAYERGEFGNSMLEQLGRGHGRSYRTALGWAQETLAAA